MKAAEQGHAESKHDLGRMYYTGEGVLQNDKESFKWFRKAAEQGCARGQVNLGVCYFQGIGVS
ncbi:MAG: hypothetical protein CMD99_03710 [Gammaproteobacteria bacterium]|nr:hypothetical protein [Gammaproteobacteria bacterium]QXD30555.1 sel1 repeat family protein [Candidatus Pelagisphaera phototrophica]|tara:strand:+ start:420 stop:608 length:189 start_codon:yes stop_codon:yes gene_type:complete